MEQCPVCKTAASLEQPSGGDYRRVECRKCGRFQITGSAEAILSSRMAKADKKAIARLSHAVRSMSSATQAEWPEINSMNLDEILAQPLPAIERQMTNLLVWAAAQLGDDQLGAVELPDEEDLTAVIGTVDGHRVDDLISHTEREGLIQFIPDDCIAITAKGWARLQPAGQEMPVIPVATPESPHVDQVIKAHCNKCHGTKNSWIRATHTVHGSDGPVAWSNRYDVVQCCGCDSLSVRHERWFSEWDEMDYDDSGRPIVHPGTEVTYYPAPTVRPKPYWCDAINDDVLRDILNELYSALNGGLSVLASVGARTLLDRSSYLLIGDPKGGFEGKLSALVAGDFISRQEKEALDAVADAGNASAHRGYTPTPERLGHIVDILENFLQRAFVFRSVADDIRKSTPSRKKSML